MNTFTETADLIKEAFDTQTAADGLPSGRAAQKLEARSRLQVNAAQAIATLALAQEVRAVALLLASTSQPIGQDGVNPDLTGAAYTAASQHLNLAEPEDEEDIEATIQDLIDRGLLMETDPADKDVEL